MRPPLLLLPGTLCDARLWREPRAALAAEAEILVPDLTRHATVEVLAAEVLAAAPPRFALAGFSFGGFVAQEMLARAPGRVLALCLLATNARPCPPEGVADRRAAVGRARAMGPGRFLREEMMPLYLGAEHLARADLPTLIVEMGEALGAETFARQTEANIARPDNRPRLAAISVPLLVACGAEDRLCPPEMHREIAAGVPGSELHVVPRAGHFLPLEAPEPTTRLLRRTLHAAEKGLGPAAGGETL